jgi:pyruvate kinase
METPGTSASGVEALIDALEAVREELLEQARGWQPWAQDGVSDRDASARNLLQYLALRRRDLRPLQDTLAGFGLSSLGRCEDHVQASVDAVLSALDALAGRPPMKRPGSAPVGFEMPRRLLGERTQALLGPAPPQRPTRIMVTMPAEAAEDPVLVHRLLGAGMDCMRINCAHDGASEWEAMVANLRRAEHDAGATARVLVDLPGPKLRTAGLDVRAQRDHKGAYVRLGAGDQLQITLGTRPEAVPAGCSGALRVGCALPEAFLATRPGHHVWLDDGKLGGVVTSADPGMIELRVTASRPGGSKLRSGRGINLPDAKLDIDLLGQHSREALQFAAAHADIVGLSFVSRARDVERVGHYLDSHARPETGMILKIETRRAFEHLPGMLLATLGSGRPGGVMIARGDLAVECGYERLAEVQEEILWLCQAAHLPVIWATDVLDNLAKTGRPSRSEITDAAMGARAECVMLNKGPRVVEAITALDDILCRMEKHQRKKQPLLPRLHVSEYEHVLRDRAASEP